MKSTQTNPTWNDLEIQLEQKLAKMYRSSPNAEVEHAIERDIVKKLGGELAVEFFR